MIIDSSNICVYIFLQLILAPILYPFGYIIQVTLLLCYCFNNWEIKQVEFQLFEVLTLIFLLTNISFASDHLTISGYATRILVVFFLCYFSSYLYKISEELLDPYISCVLLLELIPHKILYPYGYISQLLLFYFIYWNSNRIYLINRQKYQDRDRYNNNSQSGGNGLLLFPQLTFPETPSTPNANSSNSRGGSNTATTHTNDRDLHQRRKRNSSSSFSSAFSFGFGSSQSVSHSSLFLSPKCLLASSNSDYTIIEGRLCINDV
jgi:hypothetical protein